MKRLTQSGFTLIELLIVIVILGILAGVVLAVINPTAQIQKANEAALKANAEKICMALQACANSSLDAMNCENATEIGYVAPTVPTGATYALTAPVAAGSTITMTSTLGACVGTCTATPSTGAFVNLTWAGCLVN